MQLPQGFDIDLALKMADLADDAYTQLKDEQAGTPWPGPAGYTLEKTFMAQYEGKDVPLGFIATKDGDVYVSWRGTATGKEWIEDAKFDHTKCSFLPGDIQVELGFHQLYVTGSAGHSPKNIVMDYLRSVPATSTIYVTGHSLGAAIAVLNAMDIAHNTNFKNPIMYSFAGPRAGSPAFATLYDKTVATSWRTVNTNDEVPKVPFKDTFGNHYQHVKEEFDVTFGGAFPWDWGEDHSLTNYISQLQKVKAAV